MQKRSVWRRMVDILEAGAEAVTGVFERSSGEDSVAFSIAFIALSAKLAKADGTVTRDEISMFRRIFEIPLEEEPNVARVYDLCRKDVGGFEVYARQIHKKLGVTEGSLNTRAAVVDGLFRIAMADGKYHPNEAEFLRTVAEILDLPEEVFITLRAQHVPEYRNPWTVLGVSPDADEETIAEARRGFLKSNHPDRLIAEGLPPEMIALANTQLADFNNAYDEIRALKKGDGSR